MDGVETVYIYYDCNDNTFTHQDGRLIHDMSDLIPYEKLVHYKEVGGTYFVESDDPYILFEVEFPINDTDRTLYYDEEANVMYDECGFTVYNIFSIISPNDLYLFKRNKQTMDVYGRSGGNVELIWPDCKP